MKKLLNILLFTSLFFFSGCNLTPEQICLVAKKYGGPEEVAKYCPQPIPEPTPKPVYDYYIRTDGGTIEECNGKVNSAKNESGECAVNHLYWLHPPEGKVSLLQENQSIYIDSGSYAFGFKGPNVNGTSKCHTAWPYDCRTQPLPSNVKIVGNCDSKPELYGTERAGHVLSLKGSNNIELICLNITDHEACTEHRSYKCKRDTYPYGDWAGNGIVANDSDNVVLDRVDVHGFAGHGILAGRISNWTIKDSLIRGNGWAGWDGDIGANSSNSGYIKFINTTIEYNGCVEDYPDTTIIKGCCSQNQGCYGDGLGTGKTNGDWYFENVNISHNVSDGLDLLYFDTQGTVTIKGGAFEGNGGNQVKSAFPTSIDGAKIYGECGYFSRHPELTWDGDGGWSGDCRAYGNTISLAIKNSGSSFFIDNTEVIGEGDVLLLTGGSNCDGSEVLEISNSSFKGGPQFGHPDTTAFYWAGGSDGNGSGTCGQLQPTLSNVTITDVKR